MHDEFMRAVVEAALAQAECCADRFVHGEDVSGRKCHFFRELDRHTMYYVRARRTLLRRMRGGLETAAPDHDLGSLTQAEAEAVVMSTVIFRLFNRMDAFVRWHLMSKHVRSTKKLNLSTKGT